MGRMMMAKYIAIQALRRPIGSLLRLIFNKFLGVAHQRVQLAAIIVVSVELFLLSKYYVF